MDETPLSWLQIPMVGTSKTELLTPLLPAEALEKNRHWKALHIPRNGDILDDVPFLTD